MVVQVSSDCESNGTFPILVLASGGPYSNFAQLGYAWQNGNEFPLDGGAVTVAMSGSWSTTATAQRIVEANVPTGLYESAFATYGEVADGVVTGWSTMVPDDGGGATSTFRGHPGFGTSAQNEVMISPSGAVIGAGGSLFAAVSAIATAGPVGADASASFDLSTSLPLITNVTVGAGADASGTPSRPYVSWSSDAGLVARISGVALQLTWTTYYDDNTDAWGTWTFVVPPTVTSITAPALPPRVAGWGPGPTSQFYTPSLVAVEAAFMPNYASFREGFRPFLHAFASPNDYAAGGYGILALPALPPNATVRLTGVAPPL